MFPSVTQILSPFSGIDAIKRRFPHAIERAAQRGSLVHGFCEGIASGIMPVAVPSELQGYVDSFMLWFERVDEIHSIELRVIDTVMGFHGQYDIICRMRGDAHLSLWDYKTPEASQKTWPLQIAAYRHLAKSQGIETARGGTIRLRKTGRPPLVEDYRKTQARDWSLFVSCLNVHNNLLTRR